MSQKNSKHTPGPWKNFEKNWILGPDGFPIAVCDPGAFRHKRAGERCANVNLIAAAPDLLAVAQEVRRLMTDIVMIPSSRKETYCGDGHWLLRVELDCEFEDLQKLLTDAHLAIAKAEALESSATP